MSLRQKVVLIGSVISAIITIIFVIQNREKVHVDFLFWGVDISIILLMVVNFILGGLLVLGFYIPDRIKLKNRIEDLEDELNKRD